MTEQNSGHTNFNKEEFPIPIPPIDQAWQSMQQRLDMELPVGRNLPARSPMRHIWVKVVVTAIAVATVTTTLWLYSHKQLKNASLSNNIADDTNLVVASPDNIPDSQSNTVLQQSSSSIVNNISDEQSDTINNDPLSTSISSSSSKSLPSSLQSAELPASSPPPVTNKQYTAKKNVRQFSTGLQTTSQQVTPSRPSGKQYPVDEANDLTTAEQPATDKQSAQSATSDEQHAVEHTSIATPRQTHRQQLPVKPNTYKTDRAAEKTFSHHPLQLTPILTPLAKTNTSLQHKANLLVLHEASHPERAQKWALYIQLNIPIPLYKDSTYFMGPDGKDQFYRNLIPAVRIERKLWKGALSLDVQPAVSAALQSDIPKKDSGIAWYPYDTARVMIRQYGWGLALQYQLPVYNKWQLGAGIQTSFIRKAVVHQNISDTLGHSSSGIYPASPEDKQALSKVRFNGMAELNYVAGKWQLGVRALVPITRVSKTRDISTKPLHMELVIRRKLWTK